jgi:hypothetical protein
MLPPKCQNPDCKRGNKKARPEFAPPVKAHRSTGRVRGYQSATDMTLEDPTVQANKQDYLDAKEQREFKALPPAEQAEQIELVHRLRQQFGYKPQHGTCP